MKELFFWGETSYKTFQFGLNLNFKFSKGAYTPEFITEVDFVTNWISLQSDEMRGELLE